MLGLFYSLASLGGGLLCLAGFAALLGIWGWMLADALLHEPNDGWDKLLWVYAVLLTAPLGGVIYLVARRPRRIRQVGE